MRHSCAGIHVVREGGWSFQFSSVWVNVGRRGEKGGRGVEEEEEEKGEGRTGEGGRGGEGEEEEKGEGRKRRRGGGGTETRSMK